MSQVDVIVPCYNYGRFLRGCVESILGQTGVDVRVLIIDDASPDCTPVVSRSLTAQDTRVTYRRHDQNRGHVRTYNEGLEWAEGDYLLVLSADDMLISGALARAARLMDSHPEVSLTYGQEIKFQSHLPLPEVPQVSGAKEQQIMTSRQFLEYACNEASNFVPTPTAVVRTATQKKIGGYCALLPHTCDLEMWLRFGAHAAVGILNAYQAYYRKHSANMTLSYPGVKDHQQVKAAFDRLFMECSSLIEGADRLRTIADRRLAEEAFWAAHAAAERGEWGMCRELFNYAGEMCPALKLQEAWQRLTWKQRMKSVYPLFRPVINGMRQFRSVVW